MTDASFAAKRNLALTDAAQLRRMKAFVAELGGLDSRVDALEAGATAGTTTKVAAAVIAAGQAVRPNPAGLLVLAQGDATNNAKGVMLAATGAAVGFAATLAQR